MWSAGLQSLKHSPVWGIGFRNFDTINVKAAHSAFVQCFAELGIVGYVLWLGLLLLTLDDLRLIHASTNEEAADLRKWARAIQVSLIGFLVGSIFLSRAYDVQLFILIGLGTAIAELARRRGYLARNRRGVLNWIYILGGTAVASIIGYWLYMRLFALRAPAIVPGAARAGSAEPRSASSYNERRSARIMLRVAEAFDHALPARAPQRIREIGRVQQAAHTLGHGRHIARRGRRIPSCRR